MSNIDAENCPICGIELRKKRIRGHLRRAHGADCPICDAPLNEVTLQNHLLKTHGIDEGISEKEIIELRVELQARKKAEKEHTAKARSHRKALKKRIIHLIKLVKWEDDDAKKELEDLIKDPDGKMIMDRLVTGQKRQFKRGGKYSTAGTFSGGKSVQGGAPGLGKRR